MLPEPFDFVAQVRGQVWTNWNRAVLVLLVVLSANSAVGLLADDEPVQAAINLIVDATTFLLLLCFREVMYRRVDRHARTLRAAYGVIDGREPAVGFALTVFRRRAAAAAVFSLILNRKPDALAEKIVRTAELPIRPERPGGPNGPRAAGDAAEDCSQGHAANCKHKRL